MIFFRKDKIFPLLKLDKALLSTLNFTKGEFDSQTKKEHMDKLYKCFQFQQVSVPLYTNHLKIIKRLTKTKPSKILKTTSAQTL